MLDPFIILAPLLLLPVVALLRFIGCSFPTVTFATDTFSLSPDKATLGPNQTTQFSALVNNLPTTEATWSANAPAGLFTAPDPYIPGSPPVTVTATSTTIPGSSASGTVTLASVTVTITPPAATLKAGESITFSASVDPTPDKVVKWTNTTTPTSGVFKAPTPYVMGSAPVIVTAAAHADPNAKGMATINLIGNGAQFVTPDTTTLGTWKGIYGSAGWVLAALPTNIVNLPGFLPSLTLPPATATFSFADPTNDPRALQKPPAFAARFADVWFDTNILTMEFDFVDFQTHRIALYCLDWDNSGRAQTIEILDGSQAPPVVIGSHNLTNFNGGVYLIWDLSGKVLMRVTKTAGPNLVINGIFFQ